MKRGRWLGLFFVVMFALPAFPARAHAVEILYQPCDTCGGPSVPAGTWVGTFDLAYTWEGTTYGIKTEMRFDPQPNDKVRVHCGDLTLWGVPGHPWVGDVTLSSGASWKGMKHAAEQAPKTWTECPNTTFDSPVHGDVRWYHKEPSGCSGASDCAAPVTPSWTSIQSEFYLEARSDGLASDGYPSFSTCYIVGGPNFMCRWHFENKPR